MRRRFAAAAALGTMLAIALPASATPDQVILVRHAEKADAAAGNRDPDLSAQGRARAFALEVALRDTRIDAVLTTPFQRTRQTAAPLLQRRLLAETVVPVDGDHDAILLARLRALPAGSTALVVGHGNTLAPLIRSLGGPALADLAECEFDRLFVLDTTAPVRLIQARYGAPSAGCAGSNP